VEPEADAGSDQTVELQQEVTLDGSRSSDPEGEVLTFAWDVSPDNPAPVPVQEDQVRFSFVPTVAGTYWFVLTVSDGESTSADSVKITVIGSDNRPPLADAGPDQFVAAGAIILLDAFGSSDPDGDPIFYRWQTIDPPGQVEMADSTAQQTTVTVFAAGDFRFRLTVTDGRSHALTASDEVIITVTPGANQPPVAHIDIDPEQQVFVGTTIVLDGSGSADADGDSLVFHWTVQDPFGVAVVLADSTGPQPAFLPSVPGEYVVILEVDDGSSISPRVKVTLSAVAQVFAEREGMIEIPSGSFTMGSNQGAVDEKPPHRVVLSTFWIDKFEITAGAYQACADSGYCAPAEGVAGCNAGRGGRADHPINCVDWEQARDYCIWAGKRLPTETEWEKAARGPDGRRFVWGDELPARELMNYGNNVGSTTPIGTYPDGVSFYGLHNMGGNVHEWTADFYDAAYYSSSPEQDPPGPESGILRVVRGSSWRVGVPQEALTATVRQAFQPTSSDNSLGFRCARTESPP